MYKKRLAQSGHSAIAAHALAFDATWALGQALSYTEQMRIQIMTVNGALNDSNCSNWNEKVYADLSHLFNEKCNILQRHLNCSNGSVIEMSQDCMVEELAQYTNCEGMDGGLVPLNEFNYSNTFMGCVIRYNLQQTDFVGMSVSSIQG